MGEKNDVLEDLRRWLEGSNEDRPFLMREIDIEFVRRAAREIERLRRERASRGVRGAFPPDDLNAASDG